VIGATTEEEYTKYIEKDKALTRRFEKVTIEQPDFNDAVRIVQGVAPKYQEHHKITYTDEAMVASVKFAQRYLSERNLPDIALDIVDEAASEFAVREEFARGKLPDLNERVPKLQKLFKDFEGKDPEKDTEAFEKLEEACGDFAREVNRLKDMWGHRLDLSGGDA
jgi:ATP-dependent Clp protease ATP-binding subunit ClpA